MKLKYDEHLYLDPDHSYGAMHMTSNRFLRIRRWPRWINNMLWYFRKFKDHERLVSTKFPVAIDYDGYAMTIDGIIFHEWLKENCVGDVWYYEECCFMVQENTHKFGYAIFSVEFADKRDLMMFKLAFG